MIRMITVGVAALVSCGLYAAASTVHAGEEIYSAQPQTITSTSVSNATYRVVPVADLNLLHPAGMNTLRGRIRAAVDSVCGEADFRRIRSWKAIGECREAAFSDAMAQADGIVASVKVAAR